MFAILTRGSGKLWHENQWKIFSAEGPLDFDLINHSSNRLFSDEVMHMRKFDYYSADHTWGGQNVLLMYYVLWGKPNQRTHFCV